MIRFSPNVRLSLIGTPMKNQKMTGSKTIPALLFALSLTACGTDSPETMLASAKDYLAKNDAKAAVIQLKNALQSKPDLAEARFLLGKALLDEGNVSGADVEFRKAADLKYPADQLVPLQARALLLLGQTKKVIDDFGKVQLSSRKAGRICRPRSATRIWSKASRIRRRGLSTPRCPRSPITDRRFSARPGSR